jgi:hypothetical protein
MPTLDRESPPTTLSTVRPFRVVYQSPDPNGWAVATMENEERESVGICWNTSARTGRARFRKVEDWFILPAEIAQDVLLRAKELRVQQRLEMSRSYEEQAADADGEAEALEWCDALIGDAYAPDTEKG